MGGALHDGTRGPTRIERRTERDLYVIRTFEAPARLVYAAWTEPSLFMRWWAPASLGMTIRSCDMDVRTGGGYRLEFAHPDAAETMTFFGRYTDVVPERRLVWTNEEGEGGQVTTVTFEEEEGRTRVVLHEAYPTKDALDQSLEGMDSCMPEQYDQLDTLLQTLAGA